MRFLSLLFLLLVVGVFADQAFAQCCCSGVAITITDGSGEPLQRAQVKISEIRRRDLGRFSYRDNAEKDAKFHFQLGCASGKDTLIIESDSSTMRIRFKIYGEFGHPKGEIVFTHGDYVAELVKESEDEVVAKKFAVRPAEADEMKEIEPIPEKDGSANETTQAFGSLLETRGAFHLADRDRSFRVGAADLFSADRNGQRRMSAGRRRFDLRDEPS